MQCINCGTVLRDGAKFCTKCGTATSSQVNTASSSRNINNSSVTPPRGYPHAESTRYRYSAPVNSNYANPQTDWFTIIVSFLVSIAAVVVFFLSWLTIVGQSIYSYFGYGSSDGYTIFAAFKPVFNLLEVLPDGENVVAGAILGLLGLLCLSGLLVAIYLLLLIAKKEQAFGFGRGASGFGAIVSGIFIAGVIVANSLAVDQLGYFSSAVDYIIKCQPAPYVYFALMIVTWVLTSRQTPQ